MKRLIHGCVALVLGSVLVAGCTKVEYGDAQSVETVNTDFGSTDLQRIANKMVDDLLAFPPVVNNELGNRPVLFVDHINNKTSEHIDTESITDSIQTKLIKSGKFRFVDMTAVEQVKRQLNYQQNSGLVDEKKAVQVGKQVGAQFMLYGNLSSIVKKDDSTKDVYFKFTLKMTNLETGIIEWSDEKEIRKTRSKSLFGL